MKIGIIFAMDVEKKAFDDIQDLLNTKHEIITYICGIGKVNAASTVCKAVLVDSCDFIINCGVAGGINESKQFETYYASKLMYSDVDLTIFERYELGQMPGMPVSFKPVENNFDFSIAKNGDILSQDTFATDKQQELFQSSFANFKLVDMESTAIAHACFNLNTKFAVIRAVSDLVFSPNNHLDYEEGEKIAATNAAITLVELLNQI